MATVTGNPRIDIGAYLAEWFQGKAVNVYNYPAETIAYPAVVVDYSDPMLRPSLFNGEPAYVLSIYALVQRGEIRQNIDAAEQLTFDVVVALSTGNVPGRSARWLETSGINEITVSGVEGIGTVTEIEMRSQPAN